MIVLSVLVWLVLSLFFPNAFITYYCDIPILALLLANNKLTLARYAIFLSLLNTSFEPHAFFGISALIRLFSIDLCHLILKNIYVSTIFKACLNTLLLVLFDWLFSCFILPAFLSTLFYEVPVWNTKLYLFSSALALGVTLSLFAISHLLQRFKVRRRRSTSQEEE